MLYFNNNPLSVLEYNGNRVIQVDYKENPSAQAITVWKSKRTVVAGRTASASNYKGIYKLCNDVGSAPFYSAQFSSNRIVDAITYKGVTVAVFKDNESSGTAYGYYSTLKYTTDGINWYFSQTSISGFSVDVTFFKLKLVGDILYLFALVDEGSTTNLHVYRSADGINWSDTLTNLSTSISIITYNKADSKFYAFADTSWYWDWNTQTSAFVLRTNIKVYSSTDGVDWVISDVDTSNWVPTQLLPSEDTTDKAYIHCSGIFSPTENGDWYAPISIRKSKNYTTVGYQNYLLKSNDLIHWTFDADYVTPLETLNLVSLKGLTGSSTSPLYLMYFDYQTSTVKIMDVRTKTYVTPSFLINLGADIITNLLACEDIFVVNIENNGAYTHYYTDNLLSPSWNVLNAMPDTNAYVTLVTKEK